MDKYTTSDEAGKSENKDKIVISNDAYAISDFLDKLIKQREHERISK